MGIKDFVRYRYNTITTLLSRDKLLHYTVGTLLYVATYWLMGYWALVVVIVAAVGKEVYDKVSGKGTPEWLDAIATVIGGIICLIISMS